MTEVNPYGDLAFNAFYNNPAMAYPAPAIQHAQPGQIVTLQMPPLPPSVMCSISQLPVQVRCPLCNSDTTTITEKQTSGRTYLLACILTAALCCWLLPCLWDSLKDTVHYCSNCKAELGRYNSSQGRGYYSGR